MCGRPRGPTEHPLLTNERQEGQDKARANAAAAAAAAAAGEQEYSNIKKDGSRLNEESAPTILQTHTNTHKTPEGGRKGGREGRKEGIQNDLTTKEANFNWQLTTQSEQHNVWNEYMSLSSSSSLF